MPDSTLLPARNNPVVFTFVITIALAAAVLIGASLTSVPGGSMQDVLRHAGFGWNGEILGEQRRQAQALEKIEISLSRMRADFALLNARVAETEDLYQENANTAWANRTSNPDHSRDQDASAQSSPEFDLGALRASFDEETERNRDEFRTVNRRLDWLEEVVYRPDGAGQPAPARRHSLQLAHRWRVLQAGKGVAVISNKDGAIDVTPGLAVPDLGRIAAIRQERGRWVVVTENGTTIRER